MDPLKTIIYIHKEGFHKTEENDAFAQEELDYSATKQINFLHPYLGTYKLYIDGLNPLQTNHQVSDSNFDGTIVLASKFTNITIEPIDLAGGADALYQTLSLALNKELQPVLIHCRAGRHRTAMVQMILRYLEGGKWINSSRKYSGVFRAKKDKNNLMERHDLIPLEYEYFNTAHPKARIENIEFIRDFMNNGKHAGLRKSLQKLYKDSL
ncbi:MAG: hypothetical protein AB8G05_21155 [Oligoflexales bacterium]